jgi:hypothetical protein
MGDDMRVRQAGGGARFAQKAFTRGGMLREMRGQHLNGHVPVELHITREVHDAHTAAAELALERVLAGEG